MDDDKEVVLRVVIVIPSLSGGGVQRVVSILSRMWTREHRVTIAVFDGAKPSYDIGGSVVNLDLPASTSAIGKSRAAIGRCFRLAKLFRQIDPDKIVAFSESANFAAIVAGILTGRLGKLRVSVRVDPAILPRIHRLLMRSMYRLPVGVVAVSGGVKGALIKMGLPARSVEVIPNPVEIDDTELVAPPGGVCHYILGVGRLVPQKGFDLLLRSFAQIRDEGLNLVIVGEGEERARILEIAHDLRIGGRVYLVGEVTEVRSWYRYAECFVLSSRHEGRPNVLVEAMVRGCPVVSFDCPYGPAEIIVHEKNGLLVSDGDICGLADAVGRLLADGALRQRISEEGREWARGFAAEKIARLWW